MNNNDNAQAATEAAAEFYAITAADKVQAFIQIPLSVASGEIKLTASQILLYAALANAANNKTRKFTFTRKALAVASGLSAANMGRSLTVLTSAGLITLSGARSGVVQPIEGERWALLPVVAVWASAPSIMVLAGAPRFGGGFALKSLLALLLAVDFKTMRTSRTQESIARAAGMSVSAYRAGLADLTASGLVVSRPSVEWVKTEHGVKRAAQPVRIRWSALSAWPAANAATGASVALSAPSAVIAADSVKPAPIAGTASKILRPWITRHHSGKYSQSIGHIFAVVNEELNKGRTEAELTRALNILGEETMVVSAGSIAVALKQKSTAPKFSTQGTFFPVIESADKAVKELATVGVVDDRWAPLTDGSPF